ncbi:TetR/AcrR family transcriptional regulator [Brachybacterium sacelli]|uniref:AcrR family transcriptional regulator n=1 Tax=Brachybacterium sacelli TaxID=173364 RepID=A0ABS4WX51_9MICO|nr:TetR/AcrR family transcriptional regulator C-terminal domain-containing protein [Brachybacterium sacelli]MBP2380789.1 AcrR family transcriptional regulator [Brachybacterium sacelli]
MSYWNHRKEVRRERSVDHEALARASAILLDDGGPRALTVRSVASALQVAPSSVYSRVHGVEDLFDLALDHVLGEDQEVAAALRGPDLMGLLLAQYRHLLRHRWACEVISRRPPRGPNHLQLSERMCDLLVTAGAAEPLGTSYAVSNLVIGSAVTAPLAEAELAAAIDEEAAPVYASLHRDQEPDPEAVLRSALATLLAPLRPPPGTAPTRGGRPAGTGSRRAR